ncbi:MAG: CYTH domain-containing protein, partial [Candidatus Aenigmarchaeota archaeon]|nr:CYTH domain-containing protein [Candidatus Aenigmarchaeota archaeon]
MNKEIELKIKVTDFENIRTQLKKLKAKNKGLVFEKNIIFDTGEKFKKNDCVLRLRKDKKTTLCFKGPREK